MKFLFLIGIALLMFGCDTQKPEINQLSEKKMRQVIDTAIPVGSTLPQIETFLKENKIAYTYHEETRDIGALIRTPMKGGISILFAPHIDYQIKFFFDEKNQLTKYDWRPVATGL